MPIQTTPLMPGAFPSFMSVFGSRGSDLNEDTKDSSSSSSNIIIKPLIKNATHAQQPTVPAHTTSRKAPYSLSAAYSSHPHTYTASTRTQYSLPAIYQPRRAASISSDSTDSSPTTTISTFDSPAVTEPSPSSSPESPNSTLPLSTFKSMMKSPAESQLAPGEGTQPTTVVSHPLDSARAEASSSRNVKNLSLAMSGMPTRPATSAGFESSYLSSTPLSPLKGSLKTGRRKPTNLSIQTPGLEKTSFFGPASGVPSTPSQRPSLQHFPSSPALPSLLSPISGPAGGMTLSPPSLDRRDSKWGAQSIFSNSSASSRSRNDLREEEEEEDDHDRPPKSQETQEKGYPNGPIRIYDSGVFLYLEPNREEASRFDTIINVAKEIKNPFDDPPEGGSDTVMSLWRGDRRSLSISEPQTAVSEISFKSAFEWPEATPNSSPTTPKAGYPPARTKKPEYIHVRWDHNSELTDDLLPLCQIIDSRTAAGKTVLIHCQLGVSRSASLVLAYGLYKGYQPDFHTMYGAVKERSQWISPNMSLIYQLMDFRTKVEKGQFSGAIQEPPAEWFASHKPKSQFDSGPTPIAPIPPMKPLMKSTATQTDEHFVSQKPDSKLMKPLPPVPLFSEQHRGRVNGSKDSATTNTISSADSTQTVFPVSVASQKTGSASKRPAPRPLPLRDHPAPKSLTFHIPHHHSTAPNRFGLTITQPTPQMDLAMQDVPDTPSLFSPRQSEFTATPFSQCSAGDLALNANQRSLNPLSGPTKLPTLKAVDPRSPHQWSVAGEIIRSIDEVL